MNNNIVEIRNCIKSIRGHNVIDSIDLDIVEADCIGVVGENGSGKSMLLKIICGLVCASSGLVKVFNDIVGYKGVVAKKTGILIERPGLLENYSALNQLEFFSEFAKNNGSYSVNEIMAEFGLDPSDKRHIRKYSVGMKQKVGLALCFIGNPELIILDEPTSNLDDNSIENLYKVLNTYKNEKRTIIIASHQREEIKRICNKTIELKDGKIINRWYKK